MPSGWRTYSGVRIDSKASKFPSDAALKHARTAASLSSLVVLMGPSGVDCSTLGRIAACRRPIIGGTTYPDTDLGLGFAARRPPPRRGCGGRAWRGCAPRDALRCDG